MNYSACLGRALAVVLTLASVAPFASGACADVATINRFCFDTSDCRDSWNYVGGSTCIANYCECPANQEACCPDGSQDHCPQPTDYACRPAIECKPPVDAEPDAGLFVDAGPLVDAAPTPDAAPMSDAAPPPPPPECTKPEDCFDKWAQPDPRCGKIDCVEGACVLDVNWPGPALDSQKPGDCHAKFCDQLGAVVQQIDLLDSLNDGNPCTVDACKIDGTPQNGEFIADGTPCPLIGSGICFHGECVECAFDGDCNDPQKPFCLGNRCSPLECDDNNLNDADPFLESDVDCGGPLCAPCDWGRICNSAADCVSGVCLDDGTGQKCRKPTCQDGKKNDGETGSDCGMLACSTPCPDGEGCTGHQDCVSGVCIAGACAPPSCTDGTANGKEGGEDCGGDCVLACEP